MEREFDAAGFGIEELEDDWDEYYGTDTVRPYRRDDPNVWGLLDVARGRTPDFPVTVHMIAGDSASGVVGILYPGNRFVVAPPSRSGQTTLRYQDGGADDGQNIGSRVLPVRQRGERPLNAELPTAGFAETRWDGAVRQPEFEVELEDGTHEVRREHSRGLLLGAYPTKPMVVVDGVGLHFPRGDRFHAIERTPWDNVERSYEEAA